VALSSAGTVDLDEDSLRYEWTITQRGAVVARAATPNPGMTFRQAGTYTATLTVTDAHGASSSAAPIEMVAGNQPPTVGIDLVGGNTTFFFPDVPVGYAVRVSDREDGTLRAGGGGRIPARRVGVHAQYLPDGPGESVVDQGQQLIDGGDCLSCHQLNRKSIGPAYRDVARKYLADSTASARLSKKIREGGSGVWGPVAMPAHPALSGAQAAAMVAYIMSLADTTKASPSLPVRGAYTPGGSGDAPPPQGVVQLRAVYTDRGANGMPPITTEQALVLRSPSVVVASGTMSGGVSKQNAEGVPVPITVVNRSGAWVSLEQIDLTGIGAVTFMAVAPSQYQAKGGTIEVRVDSASGAVLGTSEQIRSTTEQAPVRLRVPLQPTSGIHDLYFVFRNPDASGEGFLFGVLTATFEAAATSPR
jgi:cytochrome c